MAATTSFSPAISATSKTLAKPATRSFAATNFAPGPLSLKLSFKLLSLRLCVTGGSTLGAHMVSMLAISKSPELLNFETSIFKKEKISLAGPR
ncbi:hypothetical protein TanjilG_27360 [Lupinus angustifolius]|uniref:Uncharacterized protein n=1 Tax=Lupinus angustifolius TaxID=3871 RepID=A0A1J7IML0_LUPAN|nr:hypothetical protein TanjilG_27360 [Lupinus angustifolius]